MPGTSWENRAPPIEISRHQLFLIFDLQGSEERTKATC